MSTHSQLASIDSIEVGKIVTLIGYVSFCGPIKLFGDNEGCKKFTLSQPNSVKKLYVNVFLKENSMQLFDDLQVLDLIRLGGVKVITPSYATELHVKINIGRDSPNIISKVVGLENYVTFDRGFPSSLTKQEVAYCQEMKNALDSMNTNQNSSKGNQNYQNYQNNRQIHIDQDTKNININNNNNNNNNNNKININNNNNNNNNNQNQKHESQHPSIVNFTLGDLQSNPTDNISKLVALVIDIKQPLDKRPGCIKINDGTGEGQYLYDMANDLEMCGEDVIVTIFDFEKYQQILDKIKLKHTWIELERLKTKEYKGKIEIKFQLDTKIKILPDNDPRVLRLVTRRSMLIYYKKYQLQLEQSIRNSTTLSGICTDIISNNIHKANTFSTVLDAEDHPFPYKYLISGKIIHYSPQDFTKWIVLICQRCNRLIDTLVERSCPSCNKNDQYLYCYFIKLVLEDSDGNLLPVALFGKQSLQFFNNRDQNLINFATVRDLNQRIGIDQEKLSFLVRSGIPIDLGLESFVTKEKKVRYLVTETVLNFSKLPNAIPHPPLFDE